ncbi:hypothetical protein M3914_003098 [Vibrio metschnikovii]|nr:hypothetical protein [Vibrio metschnikovii]
MCGVELQGQEKEIFAQKFKDFLLVIKNLVNERGLDFRGAADDPNFESQSINLSFEHETLESAQMWIRSKYGPVVEHDEDENEEFSLDNGAIESYRIL